MVSQRVATVLRLRQALARRPVGVIRRDLDVPARRLLAVAPQADFDVAETGLVSLLPARDLLQRPAVLDRHHLDEFGQVSAPIVEDRLCARGASVMEVVLDEPAKAVLVEAAHVGDIDAAMAFELADLVAAFLHHVILARHWLEIDHGEVAAALELAVLVENIGDAARHAGGEISPGGPDHDDHASGHVLAAMVSGALDHGNRARVPHGKALAGDAAEIALPGNRAIEHGVAHDDRLLRHDARFRRRADDDASAGKTLADIVVGLTDKIEGDAMREPRAEALPGGARHAHPDRVFGQSGMAVTRGDFARQHRPGGAIGVPDRKLDLDRLLRLDRLAGEPDQLHVEDLVEAVILPFGIVDRDLGRHFWLVEDAAEIEAFSLPMVDGLALIENLRLADHLGEGAEAERSHVLAHLLGDEEEEIDDVLGLALEARAEHRVLRGDPDGAGVQMAFAHHDAACRYQRRGRKTELVGAEQGAHQHVASGADAAIDLHGDTPAQAVEHERLLRLGEADLPGRACMLDRGERRSSRATFEAGDGHMIRHGLGDARGDRADADLSDELHRDVALRVDVLEIEYELLQVLDRIDVVMRRRRNETDARRRVPHLGDNGIDLMARELASLAGLGPLRHLDLHHVGIDQIFRGHAEAARRHLLDLRAHRVAVRQRLEPVGFLAAFAGVRFAADAVHGDGKRGMRLAADRAERHGAGREALDDPLGRLDLIDGDWLAPHLLGRPDAEHAA